jgi:ABC-2 type transport system ATP-binding protein
MAERAMTMPAAGTVMISMDDVQFSYDGATSVLDVPALHVTEGLTLVVGPNGSGKSTLLRVAAGVDRPSRGTVRILGVDLWRDEVQGRQHLAYVPEHPELTPYATILEVLQLVARLRGLPPSAAADALDRVGLVEVAWRTVRELSMGQRRRALLAAALIGEPRVVILDEPMETMDAATRILVREWVLARRDAGAAVLLATHDTEPFVGSVDRVLTMAGGRARAE